MSNLEALPLCDGYVVAVPIPELTPQTFRGLTFGAHTRDCYYRLKEGWATTPIPGLSTDLYMWRKFLTAFGEHSRTIRKITALNFRAVDRQGWSEQQRDEELKSYFEKISTSEFLRQIYWQSLPFCPRRYKIQYILDNWELWLPIIKRRNEEVLS